MSVVRAVVVRVGIAEGGLLTQKSRLGNNVYVVTFHTDLAQFERVPHKVYTLQEWAEIPYEARMRIDALAYRADDPLDAYTQALKEQTNDA